MEEKREVNTLVFEGGSVKGLAYVGALQVLDLEYRERGLGKSFLNSIEHVAGTSAGAITALLITLGLNLEQIKIIMQTTSFSSFADMSWYASYGGNAGKGAAIYNQGYLCEGNAFMDWVEKLLADYAGDKAITFSQLQASKHKDLHVYAVRLNDSQVVTFNAKETPDVSVALAVRMSMSIPVFFKPVRVNETYNEFNQVVNVTLDEANGTSYYVDGGVKVNYPYPLIKQALNLKDKQILGFKVDSDDEILKHASHQDEEQYLLPLYRDRTQITGGYSVGLVPYVLNALMSSQEDSHNRSPVESSRTIRCWDCNLSTFDFNLNQEKINGLLASGVQAAKMFIKQVSLPIKIERPIPNEELAFADNYENKEKARVTQVTNEIKETITSQGIVLGEEEKRHVDGLVVDMQRLQAIEGELKDYRINRQLIIEGTVTGQAGVRIANVNNLQSEIAFLKEATAHVQKMTEMGIKSVTRVERNAQVGSVLDEIGNIDFSRLQANSVSTVAPALNNTTTSSSGQVSVLTQQGMFSPKDSSINIRFFIKKAEQYQESLAEEKDEDVAAMCEELKELLETCRKDIINVTKVQRDAIRDKIKEIEEFNRCFIPKV